MKELRFDGSKDPRVNEVEVPKAGGPHQVLVSNSSGPICGTDRHEYLVQLSPPFRDIPIWRKRMSSANRTLNIGFLLARKFLTAASFGAFAWTSVAHAGVSQPTYQKSDLLLVTTVINATNPYMASWIQGS